MKYEKIVSEISKNELVKRFNDDDSYTIIPIDPANSDYQRYLRWLDGEEETGTIS